LRGHIIGIYTYREEGVKRGGGAVAGKERRGREQMQGKSWKAGRGRGPEGKGMEG